MRFQKAATFHALARSIEKGPEPTGLEPATSAVTGQLSNQLI
jgi:hypothetical protein